MAAIRCTWICHGRFPLIRPAATFSLGEKGRGGSDCKFLAPRSAPAGFVNHPDNYCPFG
jgi:hypothetical protein